ENIYNGRIVMEVGSSLNVALGTATSWKIGGTMEMSPGATVLGNDIVNVGRVSGNGAFDIARFENSGHVAPGRNFGGLNMSAANFVQTSLGVLDMTLGSSLLGNGSSLLQVGTGQLDGTLALTVASGFNAPGGTQIDLIKGQSITGVFSN